MVDAMELFFVLAVIAVVGVVGPLVAWAVDEDSGRLRWVRVQRTTETLALGEGAFRGARVDVAHERTLRDRAPLGVRLLAFTCYLPLGAALITALPWLVGLLFLFERNTHHWGSDLWVNAVLVPVYPFGCWAAARMYALGGALLSGDAPRFRQALGAAAAVVVPLNVAILLAALGLMLRFRHEPMWLLMVTPALTLTQLGLVALAGRHLGEAPVVAVAAAPTTLDDLPAVEAPSA